MSEWISVKDRLPKQDTICLVWNYKRPNNYLIAVYSSFYEEFMHHEYAKVLTWPLEITHWIPISAPQKKE